MSYTKASTKDEIESYLNDPDHLYLSELMLRIKCPIKRQRVQSMIDEIANVPNGLETMRLEVTKRS